MMRKLIVAAAFAAFVTTAASATYSAPAGDTKAIARYTELQKKCGVVDVDQSGKRWGFVQEATDEQYRRYLAECSEKRQASAPAPAVKLAQRVSPVVEDDEAEVTGRRHGRGRPNCRLWPSAVHNPLTDTCDATRVGRNEVTRKYDRPHVGCMPGQPIVLKIDLPRDGVRTLRGKCRRDSEMR